MPGDPGPMVRRRQLASLLHRYRTEAGLSVKEAAEQLFEAPSKITRIEKGQRLVSLRDIVDLCRIYGLSDEIREQLIDLARGSRERQWWQRSDIGPALQTLIGMEGSATSINQFEIAMFPGLLQTEGYADAIVRTWIQDSDKRQNIVAIRMRRQAILRLPEPPGFNVILDEAVLRRVIGGPDVLRSQLEHVHELAAAGKCSVRVLPFSLGAHVGTRNSFTVLEFGKLTSLLDEAVLPGVVFLELSDGDRYLDGGDDVAYYMSSFHQLQEQALTTEESIKMIRTAAADL